MKIRGNIITSSEVYFGEIGFHTHIETITKLGSVKNNEVWIYPGFIDLHVHGGGGHDIMEGEEAIREMLKTHARHGTTSLLATTVTESIDKLREVFHAINNVMIDQKKNEANLLGVHLEGPFLDEHKLGAQPPLTRSFNLQEVLELHKIAKIKIITVAPESGITQNDIQKLREHKIIVQLGHSNASYEDATTLFSDGIESVTHLFNAMSPMHHRAPGIVGAALAHANCAELIPDMIHVHPGAIAVALRSIPDLYFVTDATAAAGMPDGEYKLGPHQVHKCANGVRLKDGTLAGSSLTMNEALKHANHLQLSPQESARRLSSIAANLIGANDRGEISQSKRADFFICDQNLNIKQVIIAGNSL